MKPGLILLLLLIGFIFIAWIFTIIEPSDSTFAPTVSNLSEVVVREYQGEKLNDVSDFRENSIKGPQKVDIESYRLSITGLIKEPRNYTYQDILEFPHYQKVVTLHCVEGWDVTLLWEGIEVRDLLTLSKIDNRANTIIFHAVDGYSTSFPLSYIMDNPILMAYKMNNQTIKRERGFPFQLVAEDKWGYKWIKWISGIELTSDTTYKGYWETRGYSNSGDLNKSFF
jgi:DMSO/TMAO reductase YedYZ molybdopterin-dependent catalytic subunit